MKTIIAAILYIFILALLAIVPAGIAILVILALIKYIF